MPGDNDRDDDNRYEHNPRARIIPGLSTPRGRRDRQVAFDNLPVVRDLAKEAQADRLRADLKKFEDRFDIRVSSDTRAGARCRGCGGFLTGDREDVWGLRMQLEEHRC